MKPKPFAALNHFTIPFSFTYVLLIHCPPRPRSLKHKKLRRYLRSSSRTFGDNEQPKLTKTTKIVSDERPPVKRNCNPEAHQNKGLPASRDAFETRHRR